MKIFKSFKVNNSNRGFAVVLNISTAVIQSQARDRRSNIQHNSMTFIVILHYIALFVILLVMLPIQCKFHT